MKRIHTYIIELWGVRIFILTVIWGMTVPGCSQIIGTKSQDIYVPPVGSFYNQTNNPIGGGLGYNSILSGKGAAYVVRSRYELFDAMKHAAAGDVVFVPGNIQIDLSDTTTLNIPKGVTLASSRGLNGSGGALLYSNNLHTHNLINIAGDSVRITGIRIQGPDPNVDENYPKMPTSRGVYINGYTDLEVDNCELDGWSFGAIMITNSAFSHIHHNYIHNNQHTGLGYGVVLYGQQPTYSLIEANYFEENRHSIAGSGQLGISYDARYNYVTQNSNSHSFDMHADFEKPGSGTHYSGEKIRIYNNVFNISNEGVVIRGIPKQGAWIYNNEFLHSEEDVAIRQRYYYGNVDVYNNYFPNNPNAWYVSWGGTNPWYCLIDDNDNVPISDTWIGDFDGNGKDDMLILDGSSSMSSVKGPYSPIANFMPVTIDLKDIPGNPKNLYLGDFTGDKRVSIVKLENNKLSRSGINGTVWLPMATLKSGMTRGYLRIGDFNGDGKDDLFESDGSSWYVSYGTSGSWTKICNNKAKANQIIVGKFLDSHASDILVADGTQWTIYSEKNNWQNPVTVANSESADSVKVGDFNGDGYSDVIRIAGGFLQVSYNGTSAWSNLKKMNYKISQIKLGDFNGDGKTDVLVVDHSIWGK